MDMESVHRAFRAVAADYDEMVGDYNRSLEDLEESRSRTRRAQQEAVAAQEELAAARETEEAMTEEIERLQAIEKTIDERQGTAKTQATGLSTTTGGKSEKLEKPDAFGGTEGPMVFKRWRRQIEDILEINRDRYPTERSRRNLIFACLKGGAQDYMEAYYDSVTDCTSADALAELNRAYEDPQARQTARAAFKNLRCGKDLQSFVNDFRSLASQAAIAAEDQIDEMRERLPYALQAQVASMEFPDVHALIRQLQRTNQRLATAKASNPIARSATTTAPTANTNASNANSSSSSRERGLPKVQEWHANATCHTCGKRGHIRPFCPDKPTPTPTARMVPTAAIELPADNEYDSGNEQPSAKTS